MEFSFCSTILLIQYIEPVYKKLQKLSHFLAIWLISLNKPWNLIGRHVLVKAAKYEIQKPSTSCATLFRCKFWSMFFTMHDQLVAQQKHLLQVEELKRADWLICKFVSWQVVSLMKNEQQSRALLFATNFFNLQQMFLLRHKLIMHSEKRETSTKTCNETMLRKKSRVFVLFHRLIWARNRWNRTDRSWKSHNKGC